MKKRHRLSRRRYKPVSGLSLRLAWRNIWRQRRRTWLTALAMIFSNVILIFMMSIQFGSYDMMINNSLNMFSSQIQIQQANYLDGQKIHQKVPEILSLAEQLRSEFPHISVAARAVSYVLVSSEQRSFGIQLVGVEAAREKGVSTIPGLIRSGRYLAPGETAEIVIGSVMARNLHVGPGDELTFIGSGMDGSFAAGAVKVVGVFATGSKDIDRGLAEVPLAYFQSTFSMQKAGHMICISTPDLREVPALIKKITPVIPAGENLVVLDWNALMPGLKQAIQADMTSAWFMYGVLIILVAFSVLNTQLMSVLERTREFGVIMALGVKPRRLATLVGLETLLMASIGLLLGMALGVIVTLYVGHAGFSYPGMQELTDKFNLPSEIFPAISTMSLLLGPLVVFVFCLFAAVYPALKLYQLRPVEAMRAV